MAEKTIYVAFTNCSLSLHFCRCDGVVNAGVCREHSLFEQACHFLIKLKMSGTSRHVPKLSMWRFPNSVLAVLLLSLPRVTGQQAGSLECVVGAMVDLRTTDGDCEPLNALLTTCHNSSIAIRCEDRGGVSGYVSVNDTGADKSVIEAALEQTITALSISSSGIDASTSLS